MNILLSYINSIIQLSPPATEALLSLARIEHYSKNQHILEAGQYCDKIWFIESGMVRKYHLHEGKEITSWIHTENDTFTSLSSYSGNIPSQEYLQACEESTAIGISRENSMKLAQYHEFQIFSSTLMEREFVNIDIHTKELNQLDAKGKYEYLKKIAPELIKRAKLGHIASILGISQETLSRIRKV